MFRASLKSVLARRRRLALTLAAVVLGVTFVTGTLVLTDTSNRMFDEQFAERPGGADLTVRAAATFDQGMGVEVERDPLPPAMLAAIRGVSGVGSAEPSVHGQALLVAGGDPIVPAGPSVGASWQPPPLGAFDLRAGREPRRDGEVVIDAATAARAGVGVGDAIGVQTDGPVADFTVVGVAGFGDRDAPPDTTVALFDLATAQERLGLGDAYSQVGVVAADDAEVEDLRARLSAALGEGVEVANRQDLAAASAAAAKEQVAMLRMLLLVIAVTALVVGAFLIANTFAMLVAQRTREIATLRAVGATGRQVLLSVLTEAAVVGLAASTAGAGLGVVAAQGLRRLAAVFGADLPAGGLVVTPRTLAVALGIGVAVTVLAALGSARRAARVAPVEAMRGAGEPARGVRRGRLVAGGVAGAAALAVVAGVATGALRGLPAVAAVAVFVVVALGLLGPAAAARAAHVVGAPLARLGVAGRLARDAAMRAPRRTAATVTALAVGLAVVTFMTVLAASMRAAVTAAHDEAITSEFLVESMRGEMLGGLSPHVAHHVGDLPEVAVASRLQFGHWRSGSSVEALSAVDPATIDEVADLDMVEGRLADLDAGGIVVSQPVADARGLEIGDELEMTFARTGTQRLPVVGVLDAADQWAVRTGYVIGLDTYARHFTEDVDAAVFVKLAEGADAGRAETAIGEALEVFPTAALRDHEEAKAARTRTIDQIFGLVAVLLLLAVGIALLGITNTLALSVVERTRELGLLRAVGMTRRQVRRLVRAEALLVAVLGAVVGTAVGLGLAAVAVRALSGQAAMALTVPAGQLAASLAVAGAAGLLAGLLPARRAARLDVLAAIARG